MIDEYLYKLFTNSLIFKGSAANAGELRTFFKNQIEDCCKELSLPNQNALVDFLIGSDYSKLGSLFSKFPLAEIFYLINSLDEYKASASSFDELGRLQFKNSVRSKIGIENNLVLQKILHCRNQYPELKNNLKITNHNSYFFLSHDIDSIHGSFLQDGLWAAKKGRLDIIFTLLANAASSKPHWFNMDIIQKTESEYDFKSTFYWLANKGKIDSRQTNADYDINSRKVKNAIKNLSSAGFEHGLHKSISNESFNQELAKVPFKTNGNRYHYLKFKLPGAYQEIEKSDLKLDASLGFAEHYGFRNNYGYPFHPYNSESGKPHSFLEVPLNCMDGTFQRYMKIPVHETASTIIQFLEKNNTNCLLSVLWHNTFFSNYKYKGYLAEYKKILQYLHESKFQNINQSQIIETFSWKTEQ